MFIPSGRYDGATLYGIYPDWVNDATYPILYGNITSKPEYKPYMRIQVEERYTLNSKGKSVPIQEGRLGGAGRGTYAYGVAVHLQHGGPISALREIRFG